MNERTTLNARQMIKYGIAHKSMWGPEFEFYILNAVEFKVNANESFIRIESDEQFGFNGYHIANPFDLYDDFRDEATRLLIKAGISVKYHHHEVGNKGQQEILDKLVDCMYTVLPNIEKETLRTLMTVASREWEMLTKRPINEFRFIHVNERMKAFSEISTIFMAKLGETLIDPIDENTMQFLRNSALKNYKDFLEAEGYEVTYEID